MAIILNPYELLTDEDKQTITEYIISYTNAHPRDLQYVLREGNKSKRTLCKAFGNKLRVEIPIHCIMDSQYYKRELQHLYTPINFRIKEDIVDGFAYANDNEFMSAVGDGIKEGYLDKGMINIQDVRYICSYFRYYSVECGKNMSADYLFHNVEKNKALKITQNTKIMRAIRKVLEFYDFPHMELFEKWRDDVSVINTTKEVDSTLVFSIHPIDYMTMSDNNNNGSSCMSWIKQGGYSGGTIEMMNSNMAIVCYLKSKEPGNGNFHDISNKSGRTLLFANKDIMLVGKHYPYQSEVLAKTILDNAMTIFSSIGGKYQYKKQRYYDMIKYHGNYYIKNFMRENKNHFHKIFVYMGSSMYNDMIEDTSTTYGCCRNWVKESKFYNLSGKYTCMCCGELIADTGDYDSETSEKICSDCYCFRHCDACEEVSFDIEKELVKLPILLASSKIVCKSCAKKDYWYDEVSGKFISKMDLVYRKHNRVPIFALPKNLTIEKFCDIIIPMGNAKRDDDGGHPYDPINRGIYESVANKIEELGVKTYLSYEYYSSLSYSLNIYRQYTWKGYCRISYFLNTTEDDKRTLRNGAENVNKKVLLPVTDELLEDFM